MPLLDVTDVILDPLFCEQLVIYRQVQAVSSHGRTDGTSVTLVAPAPYGVVLPLNSAPLVRGPDQQQLPQLLEIHTLFRMRSASKNSADTEQYQPDIVVWNGDFFQVNLVDNFSKYGAGFIRAELASTDPIDVSPS